MEKAALEERIADETEMQAEQRKAAEKIDRIESACQFELSRQEKVAAARERRWQEELLLYEKDAQEEVFAARMWLSSFGCPKFAPPVYLNVFDVLLLYTCSGI